MNTMKKIVFYDNIFKLSYSNKRLKNNSKKNTILTKRLLIVLLLFYRTNTKTL